REEEEMNKIEIAVDMIDLHNEKVPAETKCNKIDDSKEPPKSHIPKVCSYWVRGQCKFGTNCRYAHPELCKRIMENGTCHEHECTWFHPKMCNSMKNTGYCPRGQRCFFTHAHTKVQTREHQSYNQRNDYNKYKPNERRQSIYKTPNHDQEWHSYMSKKHVQPYMNQQNENNHIQGSNVNFLVQQNTNWQAIRERAAEILAERMWNNQ
ncbi:unnamed protein product, partial [Meganyctiphanes norvegica]